MGTLGKLNQFLSCIIVMVVCNHVHTNVRHNSFFTLSTLWADSADDKIMKFFLFIFPRK